jgi:hypothetical protein
MGNEQHFDDLQSPTFEQIFGLNKDISPDDYEPNLLSTIHPTDLQFEVAPHDLLLDVTPARTLAEITPPSSAHKIIPDHPLRPVDDCDEDPFLMAYYADNLYDIQFPFNPQGQRRATPRKLGWIHYLLFRSEVVKKTTAVLTRAYQSQKDDYRYAERYSHYLTLSKLAVASLPVKNTTAISLLDSNLKLFQLIESCFCHVQISLLHVSLC